VNRILPIIIYNDLSDDTKDKILEILDNLRTIVVPVIKNRSFKRRKITPSTEWRPHGGIFGNGRK